MLDDTVTHLLDYECQATMCKPKGEIVMVNMSRVAVILAPAIDSSKQNVSMSSQKVAAILVS